MLSSIMPGSPVLDPLHSTVSRRLHSLIQSRNGRFPGTQPISLSSRYLVDLEAVDYLVTEKTDGVRALMYIQGADQALKFQQSWLVDRKQRYFSLGASTYPHWRRSNTYLGDTVLDGEIVIELDPITGRQMTCYHAFDCLVLNGEYVAKFAFADRYERLKKCLIGIGKTSSACEWANRSSNSLNVIAKSYERAYDLGKVIARIQEGREHYCDGLIFTALDGPVHGGRPNKVIKWKPPSRISIDLKVEVTTVLPKDEEDMSPIRCRLYTWEGKEKYEYFDQMDLAVEDIRSLCTTSAKIDGRILEVSWDTEQTCWRPINIRDDKQHPNHRSVARDILESLKDGIELSTLISKSATWHTAWMLREASRLS